jgi:hypothetical protein
MSTNMEFRRVDSESDAWKLLEDWAKGIAIPPVRFGEWATLTVKLSGGDYQNSLNSGQMAALVEFRMAMGRAYSLLTHGSYDMRKLRAHEEDQLQFTTRVKRGSSILETDFSPVIQAFSGAVTAYPQMAIVATVLLALGMISRPLVSKHLELKAKRLEMEERQHMLTLLTQSNEGKKKVLLFDRTVKEIEKTYPYFSQVIQDTSGAFWRLASASVDASRVEVAGLVLAHKDLEILSGRSRKTRGSSYAVRRRFKVVSVARKGAGYTVGLEARSLTAKVSYRKPELSESGVIVLMDCLASGELIEAEIDVRTFKRSHYLGVLINFSPVGARRR